MQFLYFRSQMKTNRFLFYTCLVVALGCIGCASYEEPESGLDCGRQFINATYQGNFKRAGQLLVATDENKHLLEERIEKDFRSRDAFDKERLSNASIQISKVESNGDTLQLIHFTNAYNGKPQVLKCVFRQQQWRTDLAYSYPQP